MNIKSLFAEFIGTFALILIGAGSVAIGIGGLLGAAFAHGFVVLGFIYAFGHISGTHINPAVTLAMVVSGEMRLSEAWGYWFVQLVGGTFGAVVLNFSLNGTEFAGALGNTVLYPGVTPVQGFVIEIILTFFLVNSIFNTAVSGKAGNFSAIAISATLMGCILMGGPLTGASLNPARTLGPAIVSGDFANLWLYLLGPSIGGLLAAFLYTGLLKEK